MRLNNAGVLATFLAVVLSVLRAGSTQSGDSSSTPDYGGGNIREDLGWVDPNGHIFHWIPEPGRMVGLGRLSGDALTEALGINNRRRMVGVSYNGRSTQWPAFAANPNRDHPLLQAAVGIPEMSEALQHRLRQGRLYDSPIHLR